MKYFKFRILVEKMVTNCFLFFVDFLRILDWAGKFRNSKLKINFYWRKNDQWFLSSLDKRLFIWVFMLDSDGKISDEALLFFQLIGNLLTKELCFAIKLSYFLPINLSFSSCVRIDWYIQNFIFLFFNITKCAELLQHHYYLSIFLVSGRVVYYSWLLQKL